MQMSAAVKCKETGNTSVIVSDYATKADFKKDLNSNGYTVVGRITTEGENNAKTKRYNKGCKA